MAQNKKHPEEPSGASPSLSPPTNSSLPSSTAPHTSNTATQSSQDNHNKHDNDTYTNINQDHQSCIEEMETNRDRSIPALLGATYGGVLPFIMVAFLLATSIGLITLIVLAINMVLCFSSATRTIVVTGAAVLVAGLWLVRGNHETVRPEVEGHYVFIVCGSGGHTAEMIQMLERSIRPEKASHRRWVIGKGDDNSYNKVLAFERRLLQRFSRANLRSGTFDIMLFDRARAVHQSWFTTPFSAFMSSLGLFFILATPPTPRSAPKYRFPGVVVTNGPGTGFLFLLAAHVLKILAAPHGHMKTIYVESWARVKSMSLTGRLVYRFMLADLFIVQSRPLAQGQGIFAENLPAMPVRLDHEA